MTDRIFPVVALLVSALAAPVSHAQGPGDGAGPPPFARLDGNGDGVIDLSEFKRHEIPFGEHAEAFRLIDADGDGLVTEREFSDHRPPPPPRR
jgi:hypothetical protein